MVLPCLNEEATIARCVQAARQALGDAGLAREVVVADNDSTDRSREIAEENGARVIQVRQVGYGNALQAGLASARGGLLVFLDADMSYDFAEIPRFVEELRKGADIVIGSRFRGAIDPGSMPFLHRVFGTPALTKLANLVFRCGITDINCGMRGLTKAAFERLDLHSEGMEFASEMMIKAAQNHMRIAEIPIGFHPDQRERAPHLRSFRDGWRHLQLMMHFCSVWLFLIPGLLLMVGGLTAILFGFHEPAGLAAYLVAQACTAIGVLVLLLGLIAQGRVRASKYVRPPRPRLLRLASKWIKIEKGLAFGLLAMLLGVLLFAYAAFFGAAPEHSGVVASASAGHVDTRLAVLGTTVFICGLQVFFTSLFMGLFGIRVADDEHLPREEDRPRK